MNTKQMAREYFKLWQTEDTGHLPGVNPGELYDKDSTEIPKFGTPWEHIEKLLDELPLSFWEDETATIATDIPEVVHIVVKERGIDPSRVDLDCDSVWKQTVAKTYKVSYNVDITNRRSETEREKNDMKKQFRVNIINHKYTDTVGKNGKVARPDRIIKGLSYVESNGYFGTIGSTSSLLTAGQKSVLPTLLKYKILKVFSNLHFPSVTIDISGIFLQKTTDKNEKINYTSINGEEFDLDIQKFVYVGNNNNYIPARLTKDSLPLVEKVASLNRNVFRFASSSVSDSSVKHKVAFWGGPNTSLGTKDFRLTDTGDFGSSNKQVHHACNLGKKYPEENIRALFQGRWFHWYLKQIHNQPAAHRPSQISYFPKVDLDTKWTFDTFAQKINASEEEKQLVLDWAEKQNENWQD